MDVVLQMASWAVFACFFFCSSRPYHADTTRHMRFTFNDYGSKIPLAIFRDTVVAGSAWDFVANLFYQ